MHKPYRERFIGLHGPAGEQQSERPPLPQMPWQGLRPCGSRYEAQAGLRHGEADVPAGDSHVTQERDLQPGAYDVAVESGDSGGGQPPEEAEDIALPTHYACDLN